MPIRFRVTNLTSTAGETVVLPVTGVTCIVGGNNAGKSQMLREIASRVSNPIANVESVTLAEMAVERPVGTVDETREWLEQNAMRVSTRPEEGRLFSATAGVGQTADQVHRWFNATTQGEAYLGNIADFFLAWTTAGTLATYATGVDGSRAIDQKNRPLSRVFRDGDLEAELSELARATFGTGLVLDRINPELRLRVGELEVDAPLINRPTVEYADAVAALPVLEHQGDGFRSFVGLTLLVMAEHPDVLLLDEPEAFLHPGQARALGRWLATRAATHDMQIVLATHDRDIVLGLLEGASAAHVTLIRLGRDGDRTHMTQLAPADVTTVWQQPVLRYSNVLQGLFHRRVVVCEGDGDCRFYGAALDELAQHQGKRALADDILFVPGSGKGGIPALLRATQSLGVDSRAIADFDVLRDKTDVENIVVALGGTWSDELTADYKEFVKVPNAAQSWDTLKVTGIAAVPAGTSYTAGVRLMDRLAVIGLYVVPVGEMEGFDKQIAVHGPAWVAAALSAKSHQSNQVRDFLAPLLM